MSIDFNDPLAAVDLWGKPVGPGALFLDDDNDGIPQNLDLCPDSNAGTPNADGCSAVDITLNARRLLIEPIVDRLRGWVGRLEGPEFDAFGNDVEINTLYLNESARISAEGDPCSASLTADRGADGLSLLRPELERLVAVRANRVASIIPAPGGIPNVDWQDQTEFVSQMLPVWRSEQDFVELAAQAASVAETLTEVCENVEGSINVTGTIVDVDPKTGEVHLDTGDIYGIAENFEFPSDSLGQTGSLVPGVQATFSGTAFTDGSAVVDRIQTLTNFPPISIGDLSCLELLIAPFQLSPKYTGASYIFHKAAAYSGPTDRLFLESGSKAVLTKRLCPEPDNSLKRAVYSARVSIDGVDGSSWLSNDLVHPDEIIHLPSVGDRTHFTIDITVLRSECFLVEPYECTSAQVAEKTQQNITVSPVGSYCAADYSVTEFKLDSEPDNVFATTSVTAAVLLGDARDDVTESRFSALGIPVINGQASNGVVELGRDTPFAVYKDDFGDIHDTSFLAGVTGSHTRSALAWPRMIGRRNGSQFGMPAACQGSPGTSWTFAIPM